MNVNTQIVIQHVMYVMVLEIINVPAVITGTTLMVQHVLPVQNHVRPAKKMAQPKQA